MLEKIVEGIFDLKKVPVKFMAVICVISGVLLFAPVYFIEKLNLIKFNEAYGHYLGVIFLLSGGVLLIALLFALINWIKGRIRSRKIKKGVSENLNSLTFHEQAVLREFFIQGKDVIEMPMHDPVVISLINKFIITQVAISGKVQFGDAYFGYKIIDYARKKMTYEIISLPKQNDELSIKWVYSNRPNWAKELQNWNDRMHFIMNF